MLWKAFRKVCKQSIDSKYSSETSHRPFNRLGKRLESFVNHRLIRKYPLETPEKPSKRLGKRLERFINHRLTRKYHLETF